MNDLQSLVDALAIELSRPVGLDDRRLRSLAYSSHVDELDQVRLSSILHREAPKAVTEYLAGLRIDATRDHVRIPANRALGMVARVCLPVHFADTVLGYVWLLDEPEPVGDDELAAARRMADEAGTVLYRQRQLEHADRHQDRELLGQLVGLRHGDPQEAARTLLETGRLAATSQVHVAVLQVISAAGGRVDDGVRVRMASAADRLRRAVPPHHVIALSSGDVVLILIAVDEPAGLDRKLSLLGDAATESLADAPQWTALIGVSAGYPSPTRAAAAYREALVAARVASVEPRLRPVARWEELGAFRTIAQLLGDDDPGAYLPASVEALLEDDDAAVLISTVRAWLDNGGDAKRTAEALYVHRSSLYHRLHRLETLAGINLRSGDDRLELHLGLRLLQLSGHPLAQP